MNMLTPHKIWEMLIFGDQQLEARVMRSFADRSEYMTSGEETIPATRVIKEILREGKNKTIRSIFQSPHGQNRQPFGRELEDKIWDFATIDNLPESLLDELEKVVYAKLKNPNELPVEWSAGL